MAWSDFGRNKSVSIQLDSKEADHAAPGSASNQFLTYFNLHVSFFLKYFALRKHIWSIILSIFKVPPCFCDNLSFTFPIPLSDVTLCF